MPRAAGVGGTLRWELGAIYVHGRSGPPDLGEDVGVFHGGAL